MTKEILKRMKDVGIKHTSKIRHLNCFGIILIETNGSIFAVDEKLFIEYQKLEKDKDNEKEEN